MTISDTTSILYSGHPLNYPFPGIQASWSLDMQGRARADLDLVAEAMPEFAAHIDTVVPDADVEDFWESTARAAAAVRAARVLNRPFVLRTSDVGWSSDELGQRLGPVAIVEERRHAMDPLLMHPLLLEHGGRWMSMAGYTDEPGELEDDHDVVQLALSRARAGVERLVVKLSSRKSGVFTIALHLEMTADDVHEALLDAMDGWELVRLAGLRDTMLLQDWIDMSFEYRLFVVDGEVLSGAGCIEEFTPYSRRTHHITFDDRVRMHRGHGIVAHQDSPIVSDARLIERYLEVGEKLARQYRGTVVIDVALDQEHDQVVVVELNTLPNSGLYASDPDVVAFAVADASDHGYDTYAWASRAHEVLPVIPRSAFLADYADNNERP